MKVLDMRFIRYLNLFEKITRVRTRHCFMYNNMIIFAVPYPFLSKAIGETGRNVRRINEILGKKVKIISYPSRSLKDFIVKIIEPVRFRNLEITGDEVVINAGMQSKAALIGRNRARINELNDIVKEYFGKQVRII